MAELFTAEELRAYLRSEVESAGGAKKWCRRNKISMDYALHMVANGDAATLSDVLRALGFCRVVMYKPIVPQTVG